MALYIFVVLLFTVDGQWTDTLIVGPYTSNGFSEEGCQYNRELYLQKGVPVEAYRRAVSPCVALDASNLPRCQ